MEIPPHISNNVMNRSFLNSLTTVFAASHQQYCINKTMFHSHYVLRFLLLMSLLTLFSVYILHKNYKQVCIYIGGGLGNETLIYI